MAFITEWNQTAGSFTLPLRSGYVYNFDVDYGDGSPVVHVAAYNDANATHNYAVAGTYQISITGTCGSWYIANNINIRSKIKKVIDWGNVSFASFGLYAAFQGCDGLISIPNGPITGAGAVTTAYRTFYGCSSLTSIPGTLFSLMPSCTSFEGTFSGTMFPVPAGLFDNNQNATNFNSVFYNSGVENLPDGLFRNQTAAFVTYNYSFSQCAKLKLNPWVFYLPGEQATRFAGKNANFTETFSRTTFTGVKGTAPDLWNCTFGTSPTKTNCFAGAGNSISTIDNYYSIPTAWGSVIPTISDIVTEIANQTVLRIKVTTTFPAPGTDSLICYASKTNVNLVSAGNIIPLTTSNNQNYEGTFAINDTETYYIHVNYLVNGVVSESKTFNGIFYSVEQKPTTVINITAPNYITLDNPRTSYVHGFLHLNGYIYGSARGGWDGTTNGCSVVKIKANDYSDKSNITCYRNKTASTGLLSNFDQIVHCKGFLWCLSGGFLVRINPDNLDYMVFSAIGTTDQNQPIGSDEDYLYVTTNTAVYKVNASMLISDFNTYGYNGTAEVVIPAQAIELNCLVIQKHPTIKVYSHSIATDDSFIYLVLTTSSVFNGYSDGIYMFHLQKIDKNTMQTVGDVTIPKCTDDIAQNSQYVFLAPEYDNADPDLFGSSYGLIAVKKETLEIKFLKALHKDFLTANEVDRRSYGIYYLYGKLIVHLINSKKTILLNTDNVEQWDQDFPVGGATEAVFSFKKDGVDVLYPPNEFVVDNSGMVHISTWYYTGDVMKFPLSQLGLSFNSLSLSNQNTTALLQNLGSNYGCSIRCVQDAPGIETGTIGTVQDQDGNIYDTVVINEKRWMLQNLKTTKFRNGDAITNLMDAEAWGLDETGAYCAYENKTTNI